MDLKEQFVCYIKNEKRYSEHTLRSYADDLLQFEDFCLAELEGKRVEDIVSSDLRYYIVFLLENGFAVASVNRKISTLKSFYKYLLRDGVLTKNPVDFISSLKKSRKLPSFLTEDQTIKLFEEIEFLDDFTGKRDRLILEMLYSTGIRLSELIELRTFNVDLEKNTIKVLGKNNKERIVPYPLPMRLSIINYKESVKNRFPDWDNDFFLVSSKGKKLYPELVYRVVKKYLGTVTSMSKRSPHVLRHTFATHLINNGADLNAIKELLGHANLSATQIYTHNSFEKLNAIYKLAHPRA